MKCYLKVYGNDYSIILKPENTTDKKLLDFVGEHDGGTLILNRETDRYSSYSERKSIEAITSVEVSLYKDDHEENELPN